MRSILWFLTVLLVGSGAAFAATPGGGAKTRSPKRVSLRKTPRFAPLVEAINKIAVPGAARRHIRNQVRKIVRSVPEGQSGTLEIKRQGATGFRFTLTDDAGNGRSGMVEATRGKGWPAEIGRELLLRGSTAVSVTAEDVAPNAFYENSKTEHAVVNRLGLKRAVSMEKYFKLVGGMLSEKRPSMIQVARWLRAHQTESHSISEAIKQIDAPLGAKVRVARLAYSSIVDALQAHGSGLDLKVATSGNNGFRLHLLREGQGAGFQIDVAPRGIETLVRVQKSEVTEGKNAVGTTYHSQRSVQGGSKHMAVGPLGDTQALSAERYLDLKYAN